jgi:hypothetical protein
MSPEDHQGDDRSPTEPEGSDPAVSADLAEAYFRLVAGRRDEDR